jgi:single-strand DNA-binding protein
MVGVDGELRQDRWQQDGQNRSRIEIVANYLQLLGGGQSSGEKQNFNNNSSSGGDSSQETSSYNSSKDDGFTDDIPF